MLINYTNGLRSIGDLIMALQTYDQYFNKAQPLNTDNFLNDLIKIKEYKEQNELKKLLGEYYTGDNQVKQNVMPKIFSNNPDAGFNMQKVERETKAFNQKEQDDILDVVSRGLSSINTDNPDQFRKDIFTTGGQIAIELKDKFGDKAMPSIALIKTYIDKAQDDTKLPDVIGAVKYYKNRMFGSEMAKTEATEAIKAKYREPKGYQPKTEEEALRLEAKKAAIHKAYREPSESLDEKKRSKELDRLRSSFLSLSNKMNSINAGQDIYELNNDNKKSIVDSLQKQLNTITKQYKAKGGDIADLGIDETVEPPKQQKQQPIKQGMKAYSDGKTITYNGKAYPITDGTITIDGKKYKVK
ncbi:MAG: hypothetical protein HQK79_14155 [Desulfobacterales bacterium]|nr:hypothetical protein [Desulfobacterales bacterium]